MKYFHITGIKCIYKNKDYNTLEMNLINDVNNNILISFDYYWNNDSFEEIINDLKIEEQIIIINPKDLKYYLNIFSKYYPRIDSIYRTYN